MDSEGSRRTTVRTYRGSNSEPRQDQLAVEEPLEIRIEAAAVKSTIAITMRTPGDDVALALGFLVGEGIIRQAEDVLEATSVDAGTVEIVLAATVEFDASELQRNFYTTSSCGVCGKSSLQAVMSCNAPLLPRTSPLIPASVIHALPEKQVDAQEVFSATGGLHATALFDAAGNLLSVCEDVGRHNAFDKAVGHAFLAATLPWSDKLVLLSGRASFELVQKAVMAGLPLLCAVGAPSSLAVETAEHFGMTLLGFVRDRRFNVYSAGWRIEAAEE